MAIDGGTRSPGSLTAMWWVTALLLIAFFFRAAPLRLDAVREVNAPAQFDTARALGRLGRILDGTPHPVDSAALEQTRARLIREISALGYVPEIHSHHSCLALTPNGMRCARVSNLFFRAGPETGPALLLTAHYDSVDASPGFGDDGLGIAVWLEVAYQLKQQPPPQPVVFLFTDGEELNLLGARAFIDNRADYGVEVARVINLEARGVSGPALMFETGHPNAAIVRDWADSGARPFANSMMAAVYALLPNGTDLTAFLDAGFQGINIAITGGSELYHSNRDEFAALDHRSVQHMGDQALGATRAFLATNWNADVSGGELVYADILSRAFVTMPQGAALVLLMLCFAVSAVLLFRPARHEKWHEPDWRALALPPVLCAGAAAFVFALQRVVALLRSEPVFWTAWPQALNMTIFAATLLVAALLLIYLAPRSQSGALFASGWFWLLLSGVTLSLAIPGFAMVYLIPGAVLVFTGGVAWWLPRYQWYAYAAASVCLTFHFFPIIHLIDVTMGLGTAAAFGVIEALVLAPVLALLSQAALHRRPLLAGVGAVLGAATVITLLVPAHDEQHPARLNFMANYDLDEENAALFAAGTPGSLPDELRDQFVMEEFEVPPGFGSDLPARRLSYTARPAASVALLSEASSGQGERTIRLRLVAPGARGLRLSIPAQAKPSGFSYENQVIPSARSGAADATVEIVGQSVDGAVVEITLASQPQADILVQGMWSGLPAEAAPLADLRPVTSARNRMGDLTVTTRTQRF